MINFDKLVFGYVVFKVDEGDIATVINRAIKAGLNQNIDEKGNFSVPYRMKKVYVSLLCGMEYTVSGIKGALGALIGIFRHWGIIASLPVFLLISLFLFNTVWDVRVEGCSDLLKSEILQELDKAGIRIGSTWLNIDKSGVENRILLSSDTVSWISINRRGTVAYVSIIEKKANEPPEVPNGYASIVADRDCIIEEITVKAGYPIVKVGDSVRKGDVLISGVIPQSLGGGYCYAQGSIKGRYNTEVEVSGDSEIVKREYLGNSIYTFGVKIFDHKINIFKNYGKMPTKYDIINENKEFIFLGKKIPLSLEYEIAREYSDTVVQVGYVDMVKSAAKKLSTTLAQDFENEDLLSIKTDVYEDSGCFIIAKLVLRAEVAKTKEFEYISEKK